MSGYTFDRLDEKGRPTSNGCSADYGFDPMIYMFCRSPPPSQDQLNKLSARYVELRLPKEDGGENITAQEATEALRQKGGVRLLLGSGFDWVRTSTDMF